MTGKDVKREKILTYGVDIRRRSLIFGYCMALPESNDYEVFEEVERVHAH